MAKVLVAETCSGLRRLTMAGLRKAGYQALGCSNGYEGVDKVLEYLPDVIVMGDVEGGLEMLRSIRMLESPNTPRAPVILFTEETGKFNGYKTAGVDRCFKAPQDLHLLVAAAGELLDAQGKTVPIRPVALKEEVPSRREVTDPGRIEGSPRVLIVEYEPTIRRMIRVNLERAGCLVEEAEAADGVEGLRLALTLKPDVVTLDCLMPHMDGLEVLEHLRGDPRCATIRIVGCAAASSGEPYASFQKEVGRFLLGKPFKPVELVGMVREILQEPIPVPA